MVTIFVDDATAVFLIPYQAYIFCISLSLLSLYWAAIWLISYNICITAEFVILSLVALPAFVLHAPPPPSLVLKAKHEARRPGVIDKNPTAFAVPERWLLYQSHVCGVSAALEGMYGFDQTQLVA